MSDGNYFVPIVPASLPKWISLVVTAELVVVWGSPLPWEMVPVRHFLCELFLSRDEWVVLHHGPPVFFLRLTLHFFKGWRTGDMFLPNVAKRRAQCRPVDNRKAPTITIGLCGRCCAAKLITLQWSEIMTGWSNRTATSGKAEDGQQKDTRFSITTCRHHYYSSTDHNSSCTWLSTTSCNGNPG